MPHRSFFDPFIASLHALLKMAWRRGGKGLNTNRFHSAFSPTHLVGNFHLSPAFYVGGRIFYMVILWSLNLFPTCQTLASSYPSAVSFPPFVLVARTLRILFGSHIESFVWKFVYHHSWKLARIQSGFSSASAKILICNFFWLMHFPWHWTWWVRLLRASLMNALRPPSVSCLKPW